LGDTLAPDERVKLSKRRLQHPAPLPALGCRGRFFGIGEQAMKFLSLGDLFLVSALTGAVLLVEIGVLKVAGVI
jgi:hypothetical protein